MRIFLFHILIPFGVGSVTATLHAADRILYLGDSMSLGEFGKAFDTAIRTEGHEVYTVVAGGATPYYWLNSYPPILCDIGFWKKTPQEEFRIRFIKKVPKVEDLLEEIDPSVVIVQTGTNLFAELRSKRRSADENEKVVERLIEEMCQVVTRGDRRLYWITPPDAHHDRYPLALQRKMAAIMNRVAGRFGEVFDSQSVTKFTDGYPETDGIHYGVTDAGEWADRVASDFSDFSSHFDSRGIVVAKAIPVTDQSHLNPGGTSSGPLAKVVPGQKVEKEVPKVWTVESLGNNSIIVEIELAQKSAIPKVSEFTYRRALAVYEWKVSRCRTGNYPLDTIRIAHMICIDKQLTSAASYPIGKKFDVELAPLSTYPSLERLQTIDSLPLDPTQPLFIPKLD